MTVRRIGVMAPILFALALLWPTLAAAQTPPLTLDAALALAREANLTIVAARLAHPVATANAAIAGERPNPDVTYEASRETPRQAIGASLPIELGGKRQRRIDVASAGLAAADADLAVTIAHVENDVRRAYFALMAADATVTLASDVRDLAGRARDAAAARLAAGDVPRMEAVQTELAFADADNDLAAARGDAAAARVGLNVLLGRAPGEAVTVATIASIAALPSVQDALSIANQSNVELRALDRRIAEQVARRNLANALRVPDFSVGSALTYDAQPEFRAGWRVNFGVTLPVFTRYRAGVVLEDAELTRLRAERAATAASVMGDVASALAHAAALREELTRFETDMLPRAADVEQMAQDGYAAGQTGLVALLQALQSTRDVRRRGLQAGLDYRSALADLERAIGAPPTPTP